MNGKKARRTFLKQLLAFSTFSGVSLLSFKKNVNSKIVNLGPTEANAIGNPDYALSNFKKRLKIEYVGLSCFVITSSNGTKIITDPYIAGKDILHSGLRKEPADVVTVSCGNYAHCHVYDVGGSPYVYKITEPTELCGITFRGVASRHLEIKEAAVIDPGENIIMCFEVDGIKICHLGALGHKLSGEQVKEIGKVDILMVPVGGVSSLPLEDASAVCDQLNPKVILPMHYRSERMPSFTSWASVDDFVKDKTNALRCDQNVSSSQLDFTLDELPSETKIYVPRCVY